jgi:hypothetical protein
LENKYYNYAAGSLGIEKLTAHQRYGKTVEAKYLLKKNLQKYLPTGYDIIITYPSGYIFNIIIDKLIIKYSRIINIIATTQEYPYFLESLKNKKNIELHLFDVNQDINNYISKINNLDILIISEITYDIGLNTSPSIIINLLKKKFPKLIVIGDLAQSAGILKINPELYDIAFFSLHKWLEFPWGIGVIIQNDKIRNSNILNGIEIQNGFLYSELKYCQKNIDLLTNKIFINPLGGTFIKERSEIAAKSFIKKINKDCQLEIFNFKNSFTNIYSFISFKSSDDAYSEYKRLISEGFSIKFINNVEICSKNLSGFRIATKE